MSVFGIITDKQIIRFLDTEKTISTKRSKKEKSSNRALKINFTQIPSRFKTFAIFPLKDLPLFLQVHQLLYSSCLKARRVTYENQLKSVSLSNNTLVANLFLVSMLIPRVLEKPPLQVLSKNIPILHTKLLFWS